MRKRWTLWMLLVGTIVGCVSGREFWNYVVEGEVTKPLPSRDEGTKDRPAPLSPYNVRVAYNDGSTRTEVLIPVLTSGQQIVIDHKGRNAAQGLSVVPLPPTAADKSVEDAYLQSGQPVKKEAKPVSIVKTHEVIRRHVREGNYALALQYAEQLLGRYPNHPETLRIKGSLLLKMGEREAALRTYRKVQDIEPDEQVERQVKKLEDALGL